MRYEGLVQSVSGVRNYRNPKSGEMHETIEVSCIDCDDSEGGKALSQNCFFVVEKGKDPLSFQLAMGLKRMDKVALGVEDIRFQMGRITLKGSIRKVVK